MRLVKLVIIGNATVVVPIAEDMISEYGMFGEKLSLVVLNDALPIGSEEGKFKKYAISGTSKDIPKYLSDNEYMFAYTAGEKMNNLISLNIPRERFATLIHPTAIVPRNSCKIGRIIMAPLSQLSPGAEIDDNCILYGNSFVGHDSTLDRYVVVANNASIQARVHIERGVHIGSNSTILSGLTIGEFSVVGAGSVVTKNVPPNTVVAGVPARPL